VLTASEVIAIASIADRVKLNAQSRDDVELELCMIGVARGLTKEEMNDLLDLPEGVTLHDLAITLRT
jgi:hypothetical protein